MHFSCRLIWLQSTLRCHNTFLISLSVVLSFFYLFIRGRSFSQKIESAEPAQLSYAGGPQVFHTALWNQLLFSRLCTPFMDS